MSSPVGKENFATELEELNLNFPPEVVKAIQEILPSVDPFDAADFTATDYINNRFPTEQSLSQIDDVLDEMRLQIGVTDADIRDAVRTLTNAEQDGRTSLSLAQEAIGELCSQFKDIKIRASESEHRVKEITRDIKQLDTAKRNLTSAINTLNQLEMLMEGVEKLHGLKALREYAEIAKLLQGVVNVLEQMRKYRHIPQVADLAKQVEEIRGALERQILGDFHKVFHGGNNHRLTPTKELAEACLVVDVLDPKVRRTIIDDVVRTQLAEYEVLFAAGESDGWLAKVDLRRRWFLRTAMEFEKSLAPMFPPMWQVPACMALSFCHLTRDQLSKAMQLRVSDIDVAMLLHAYKVMSEMEELLAKKYVGIQHQNSQSHLPSTSKNPFDEETGNGESPQNPFSETQLGDVASCLASSSASPFQNAICVSFQPHLNVYIESIDKRMQEQVEKFIMEVKSYRFEHMDLEESNVMACCGELFTIYKNVLVEFLRLNPGDKIIGLVEVLQKYLREFCSKVLRSALPKVGGNIPMPKDLGMKELTAVLTQVQALWKEGETPRLSEDDVRRVCSVLVSSEYCEEMTTRLEAKVKERSPMGGGSLAHEVDLFHSVLTQCIALLVTHTEVLCDPALTSMTRQNWTLDQTGDQSAYVTALANHVAGAVPLIRHNLHTSRKYFTRFCDKLASALINKFMQQVYKCRPISIVGCEQLLLDCHALKSVLLELPVVASKVKRDPPQAYTRMVTRGMSRVELVLQIVMGEYVTNNDLVDKFIQLLPDATIGDFQKVVEMRGGKDRAVAVELFRSRAASVPGGTGGAGTPHLPSPEQETSRIAKLEKLLKSHRLIS